MLEMLSPENSLCMSFCCSAIAVMNKNQIEITGVTHLIPTEPSQSQDGVSGRLPIIGDQVSQS